MTQVLIVIFLSAARPSATIEPLEQRVDVGQPVKFNCSTNYPENATFLWKRNDDLLIPIPAKVDSSVLEIRGASYLDSGSYTCEVKTVSGLANTTATLFVGG